MLCSRLLSWKENQQKKIQEKAEKKIQDELIGCTFHPKTYSDKNQTRFI
jgi:hypothetical protein